MTSISGDVIAKRLQMIKEVLPTLSRVALLVRESSPDTAQYVRESQTAARNLGVGLQIEIERSPTDLEGMHPVSTPGQEGAILAEDRLGSHGGLGLQVRLPIPGQQVGDFVGGVIWKPGQHVSKPSLRIDVVHLAGFDQGVDGGGTMTTSI